MPTRQLPPEPSLRQLKAQAKDLLVAHGARSLQARQRIREFHPRFRHASDDEIAGASFSLSDAQFTIAREYGFLSWPRLKAHVEKPDREDVRVAPHLRIKDAAFKRAVELMDTGDVAGLRAHVAAHPAVLHQRLMLEGNNYFREPTLLEFIAENPSRQGSVPKSAPEIARIILEAGAREDRRAIDSTLELVASSAAARTSGVQGALIDVLCDVGADPGESLVVAALYGEFDAVEKLIERGAPVDLRVAAATGRAAEAEALIAESSAEVRATALALAAQFGHLDIVRMLLDAAVDPNSYTPPGGHSHATPLHQAALAGHLDIVKLLVERGARSDLPDILYGGTPLGWARHAGQNVVAEFLQGV